MLVRPKTQAFHVLSHDEGFHHRNHLIPQDTRSIDLGIEPPMRRFITEPLPEIFSCEGVNGPFDPNNRHDLKTLHTKEEDDLEEPVQQCVILYEPVQGSRYVRSALPYIPKPEAPLPTRLNTSSALAYTQVSESSAGSPSESPTFQPPSLNCQYTQREYIEPVGMPYYPESSPALATSYPEPDYASYQPISTYHYEEPEVPRPPIVISLVSSLANWEGLCQFP